jgi:aryl-alcohol dehydrogenase-like predicted oxidoreductase
MQTRTFGKFGQGRALTLGGGGIGNVWGSVDRAERVATVRAALDAGVTMIDVAPTYGPGEAESVVGEALGGDVPNGVVVTTKMHVAEGTPERTLSERLRESLARLRVDHVDLLILHSQLRPDDGPGPEGTLTPRGFREEARPVFERFVSDGLIRGWGLTGVGSLRVLKEVLADDPRPSAIQCVANALDQTGDMWIWGPDERPDNTGVRASAAEAGVPVMGIRAVAAGSLADALDRPVAADHPAARDYEAAAPFRSLAAEHGVSPAMLAHRYALSMPDVNTVVLGVKNRGELAECVAAEEAGPLSAEEMRAIDALRT